MRILCLAETHPPGRLPRSLCSLAKTVCFSCHCEARSAAAIPLNNRKGNNTIVSVAIAPLKKAQRKSEGGQLFPESVFPLRATPFPKTPQKPPTPLIFKGVSVILLFHFILSVRNISVFASGAKQTPGRVEVYGVYVANFFGGIFRCAQYDVKTPYRHFVPIGDNFCHEQSRRRGSFTFYSRFSPYRRSICFYRKNKSPFYKRL